MRLAAFTLLMISLASPAVAEGGITTTVDGNNNTTTVIGPVAILFWFFKSFGCLEGDEL